MSWDEPEEERMIAEEMEEEDQCYHGFGLCIDPNCRDYESCIGCELLYGEAGAIHEAIKER